MNRVNILGVEIDNLSLEEARDNIELLIRRGTPSMVVTANPEIIWLARHYGDFRECLKSAKMITADGIGIVIAAKILGRPLKQRVTGIDLTTALFSDAQKKGYRFYFVGGRPGVAEKAAAKLRVKFPGINIVGIQHGYFQDDRDIIEDIRIQKPDILLAALGMGKQEKWIKERVFTAEVPVSIGVGGSFDVFAGVAKRAPEWMQRAGLEWLYRLIKQPSRLGRMMQLPKFLGAVIVARIIGRN